MIISIAMLPALVGCSDWLNLPKPPPEHTQASLQNYFGDSPSQLEKLWGKPSSVVKANSQSPPADATEDGLTKFKQETERERYIYPTRNGTLVFHFNLNDQVYAITYEGVAVSRPQSALK